MATRGPVSSGIVAGKGYSVVNAQRQAALDDLPLRQLDERSMDAEPAPLFYPSPRRQRRHALESLDVFRPAVGITAVVHRIRPDEDIGGAEHFGPAQGNRQEDRGPGGDVGG